MPVDFFSSPKVKTNAFLRTGAIFLLFLFLTSSYFWRNLTPNLGDRVYLGSDFLASFYPTYLTAISRIRQGDLLPLWDPTQYLGMPFLASFHVAFFYPFHLIFYFAGAWLNLSWTQIYSSSLLMIFGQVALAGFFTYLCTRKVLNLSHFPAFIAGIIYAFSEVMIASVNTVGVMESLVWLPLLLLLLDHLLTKPSAKAVAWLALVYAISILAGYPYPVIYNSLFLFGYLIFWNLGLAEKKIAKKEWGLFLISLLLGASLAAIQLIPALELTEQSYRKDLGFIGSAFSVNLEPAHLIDYLFPLYFARLGGNFKTRIDGFANYVGIITIFLAFLSFYDTKRKGLVIFCFSTFIISLLLSMGGYTSLHSLLYLLIPFYSKIRTVAIASYISSLSLAILAACGIDFLLENPKDVLKSASRKVFLLGSLTIIPIYLSLSKYLETHRFKDNVVGLEILLQEIGMFNFFIIFALVSLGAIILYIRLFPSRKFIQAAILSILVIDLFSVGSLVAENNSPIPPDSFFNQNNEVYSFLNAQQKSGQIFRVDWDDLSFHYNSAPFNVAQVGGYQSLAPQRISSVVIPSLGNFERTPALKRMLNVKYLVTNTPLTEGKEEGKLIYTVKINEHNQKDYWVISGTVWINPSLGSEIYIYELEALPRFYFADKVISLPKEEALPYLAKVSDLKTAVVADDPVTPAIIAAANTNRDPQQKSSIRAVNYRPEKIILEVTTDRDGLLVYSDTDFPGWKAFVDNQETSIIPANYFMKSVRLSPGNHRVVFSYQPMSFYFGALISGVSFLIVVFLMIRKEGRVRA